MVSPEREHARTELTGTGDRKEWEKSEGLMVGKKEERKKTQK